VPPPRYRPFPSKIPQTTLEALVKLVDDAHAREVIWSSFKLDKNELEPLVVPEEAVPKKAASPPEFSGPSGPYYVLQPASKIPGFSTLNPKP
jgi:hypothetical protein